MAPKSREVGIRLSVKDAEVAKRALEAFGKDGQTALKRIENSAKPASVSLQALNAATGGFRSSFSHFFGGVTAGVIPLLTFAGAIHQTRAALEKYGDIEDKARRSGLDVEYFQGLAYAAKLEGVEIDGLSGALETLAKNSGLAAEGKGKMVTQLKELNPELLKSIQLARTQEERVRLAADAIRDATSASERAALASALFGDQGVALAAAFEKGAAGLDSMVAKARDLGIVVDRGTIAKAGELGDKFDTVASIIDTKLKTALINLGPTLVWLLNLANDLVDAVSNVFEAGKPLAEQSTRALEAELATLRTIDEKARQGLVLSKLHSDATNVPGQIRDIEGELFRRADAASIEQLNRLTPPKDLVAPRLPASDEAKAALKEAETLFKRLRTATEEYADSIADLEAKHAAGLISQETMNRGVAEAALKFAEAADNSAEYADALAKLDDAKAKGIITEKQYTDAVESLTKRRLIAQNDWVAGVQLGLQQIQSGADEVTNDVAQAVSGWAESLGEQIGEVFRTGKLNWQDLVKTMLADIAKLATQQFITRPLAGLLGNIFGGLFGGGGGLTPQPVTNIGIGSYGSFDTGGWTGDGNPSDPAGMVHRREFVVKAGPASRYREALEAMNSGRSIGLGGGNFTVAPTYNVDGSGLSPAQLLAVLDQHSSMLLDRVSSIVKRDAKNGVFDN